MHWAEAHRLAIGIFADLLTFAGGVILSRDALLRLRELRKQRIDEKFRHRFAGLNLTDQEWKEAVVSVRWALAGCLPLVVGFFCNSLKGFSNWARKCPII
jgi:hypothetical protein